MSEITLLLQQVNAGDVQARDVLYKEVYADLQRLARQKLAREGPVSQLDAPSLVHEAYLRLQRQAKLPSQSRGMFFAYAAHVMRSVIIDQVRERQALKRGGDQVEVTLTAGLDAVAMRAPELEALDHALHDLAAVDTRAHQIVEMRYFAGLSVEEIAAALELSPATVKRDWQKARAFLFRAMHA